MARILLAVDLSYQTYRAAAAHPMLTSRRVFTGGLYGFFMTFAKMVRDTRATHVAFCQDVKPYLRSLEYPEYKQIRKKNADEELIKMYKQSMALILDTLEDCGLIPWGIKGFEVDDLIGHCVLKYRHRFDKIYAGSNDSDLFQLFEDAPNFHVYSKGMHDLMNRRTLMEKHGLTPDQFMLMTALTGTHNDIEGIPRVGEVRGKAAVLDPGLMRAYRADWAHVIDRNLRLIKLPHASFPWEATLPDHRQGFNPRALYKSLGKYDIDCTGAMIDAFDQIKAR